MQLSKQFCLKDLHAKPYFDYDINFRNRNNDEEVHRIQLQFIDDIIQFYRQHPDSKEYFKFTRLFVNNLDAERELCILKIFNHNLGYSEDKILSIYDNFIKMKRFSSDGDKINLKDQEQNICYQEGDQKYYCCVTNNSLCYDYEVSSTFSFVFEKNCKIRTVYLINTDCEYDEFLMTSMNPKVDCLKLVKDKNSWFIPLDIQCNFLMNIKCLKIGYNLYSVSESLNEDEYFILSNLLSQCISLKVLWIWGFHISPVLKALSQNDIELYEFRYSQSGVAIEEISLEFEVIRLHTPKGKANILANLKNYQISYSEDSLVSMRMIRKVEDDSSIEDILSRISFSDENPNDDLIIINKFELLKFIGSVKVTRIKEDKVPLLQSTKNSEVNPDKLSVSINFKNIKYVEIPCFFSNTKDLIYLYNTFSKERANKQLQSLECKDSIAKLNIRVKNIKKILPNLIDCLERLHLCTVELDFKDAKSSEYKFADIVEKLKISWFENLNVYIYKKQNLVELLEATKEMKFINKLKIIICISKQTNHWVEYLEKKDIELWDNITHHPNFSICIMK